MVKHEGLTKQKLKKINIYTYLIDLISWKRFRYLQSLASKLRYPFLIFGVQTPLSGAL